MELDTTRQGRAGSPRSSAVTLLLEEVLGRQIDDPALLLSEDLGFDSVQLLELIARIDERFGIDLGLEIADGLFMHSVGDVVGAVELGLAADGASEAVPEPDSLPGAGAASAAAVREPMRSLYFEHEGARLYGVLHSPQGPATPRTGVLLCHAFAHEYFQGHRALRELAVRLARAGLPVLRFEFQGVGDSSDSLWEARLEHWVGSVAAAGAELTRRTGASRLAVVGLRLGATIAALGAARVRGLEELVLWSPIVRGREYVDHLEHLHRRAFGGRALGRRLPGELLGARVHPELLEQIADIELAERPPALVARTLLLQGVRTSADSDLAGRLRAKTPELVEQVMDERWSWDSFHSSVYWPLASLKRVTEQLVPPKASVSGER